MTNEKKGTDEEKKLDIDIDELEKQITLEIDNLFMPADQAAAGPDKPAMVSAGEERPVSAFSAASPSPAGAPEPVETPQIVRPEVDTAQKGPQFDIDQFQQQVDLEIDAMFVPAEQAGFEEVSAPAPVMGLGEVPSATTEAAVPVPQAPLEPAPAPAPAPEGPKTGELELTIEAEQAPPDRLQPAAREELSRLLESFYTAYLSLDWEFTSENVAQLDSSLDALDGYCRDAQEPATLHEVLKTVLRKLRLKPDSISRELNEFIRDTQDLLRSMLASTTTPGIEDRDKVNELMSHFKKLTEEPAAEPEPAARPEPPIEVGPAPVSEVRPEMTAIPIPISVPVPEPPSPAVPSPAAPRAPVEPPRTQFMAALRSLEVQTKRLGQLQQVLSKTPVLAPVTARLGSIRAIIEKNLLLVREGPHDLPERRQGDGAEAGRAGPRFAAKAAPPGGAGEAPAGAESARLPEHLCFFDISGKRCAVLASHLVRVARVSSAKARKIAARGFATLLDFKPLFRSIGTGVMGIWAAMPSEVLTGYRFELITHEGLQLHAGEAPLAGVLLLSNGHNHGMVFIDNLAIEVHCQPVMRGTMSEQLIGQVSTESGQPIDVLNIDALLKAREGKEGLEAQ